MFKIKTVPKCPKIILQSYQAGDDLGNPMGIDVTGRFEVKTKDKTFVTSIYPFLQSDFLFEQLKGKPKILEWINFVRFISKEFLPNIKRFWPPSYLSNETIQN